MTLKWYSISWSMSLPVFRPALLGTHHDLMSFSFFLRLVSLQLPSTFPCALFTSAYCAEGWAKCHDYMGSSCLAWHSLSKPCQTWRQPGSLGTIFTERSVRYDAPSLFLWRRRNSRDPIPSLPRILKSVPVFLISCTMCKVQSFFFFFSFPFCRFSFVASLLWMFALKHAALKNTLIGWRRSVFIGRGLL